MGNEMKMNRDLFVPVILCLIFLSALVKAWNWDRWTKFAPVIFISVGFLAAAFEIIINVKAGPQKKAIDQQDKSLAFADTSYGDMDFDIGIRRAGWFFGWIFGFLLGIVLLGFHVSVPMFALLYLKFEGKASWLLSISIAIVLLLFILLVFDWLLYVPWPESLLMNWLSRY